MHPNCIGCPDFVMGKTSRDVCCVPRWWAKLLLSHLCHTVTLETITKLLSAGVRDELTVTRNYEDMKCALWFERNAQVCGCYRRCYDPKIARSYEDITYKKGAWNYSLELWKLILKRSCEKNFAYAATQGNTVVMKMVIDFCVDHLLLSSHLRPLLPLPLMTRRGRQR